jgi:drug/metabolite transporter (DMT)-like permease
LIFHERLALLHILGVVLVLASIYGIGRAPGSSDLAFKDGRGPD